MKGLGGRGKEEGRVYSPMIHLADFPQTLNLHWEHERM